MKLRALGIYVVFLSLLVCLVSMLVWQSSPFVYGGRRLFLIFVVIFSAGWLIGQNAGGKRIIRLALTIARRVDLAGSTLSSEVLVLTLVRIGLGLTSRSIGIALDGVNPAHFEHYERNPGCSLIQAHFDGTMSRYNKRNEKAAAGLGQRGLFK
jgi:hypothetical protein